MKFVLLLSLLLSLFSFSTIASENTGIEIKNATIKLPPPGSVTTAMFGELVNHSSKDVHLLDVLGKFAKTFELHTMDMSNGRMSMRKVENILVKKLSTTVLSHGGLHVMIFNLNKALIENEQIEVSFVFENNVTIKTKATVKKD
ncbi:MAG: copper chaperone PCu(A)C [Bacteriovorax sp.]|nr:copper chaperone PCu(A)C [Bacteriovorax sp.]